LSGEIKGGKDAAGRMISTAEKESREEDCFANSKTARCAGRAARVLGDTENMETGNDDLRAGRGILTSNRTWETVDQGVAARHDASAV